MSEKSNEPERAKSERSKSELAVSGDLLFAAVFLAASVLLISQAPAQVQWFSKTKLFAQPAFWPLLSLTGMVGFGAAHLWTRMRRNDFKRDWAEAAIWLRSVEFVIWFMIYVSLVPLIGYLAATLVFAPLLTFRMGYRGAKPLMAAAVMGLVVVLFFKTFLSVKIPGGAIYEYLPDGLRTLMIIYF